MIANPMWLFTAMGTKDWVGSLTCRLWMSAILYAHFIGGGIPLVPEAAVVWSVATLVSSYCCGNCIL